jgi:hypothetical protein
VIAVIVATAGGQREKRAVSDQGAVSDVELLQHQAATQYKADANAGHAGVAAVELEQSWALLTESKQERVRHSIVATAANDLQGAEHACSGDEAKISDTRAVADVENAKTGAAAGFSHFEQLNVATTTGEAAVKFNEILALCNSIAHVAVA